MPVRQRLTYALAGLLGVGFGLQAADHRSTMPPRSPFLSTFNVVVDEPGPRVGEPIPMMLPTSAPEPNPLQPPLPGGATAPAPEVYTHDQPYLLQVNPNGRAGLCEPNVRRTPRVWGSAAYVLGLTEDLGNVDRNVAQGVRLGAGAWFDDYRTLGVELSFLNIHDTFNDYIPGPTLVNAPLVFTTGDLNLRGHLGDHDRYRLDGLVGYRVLHLAERYNSFVPTQTIFSRSSNVVHAFQVGAVVEYHFGPYFGDLAGKVGVGQNRQRTTLNGLTTTDTKFAVIPEVNFRVGYSLGSGTRLFVGYNVLYLNAAARPNNLGPNNFILNAATAGLEFTY